MTAVGMILTRDESALNGNGSSKMDKVESFEIWSYNIQEIFIDIRC